jgi:hypothetical protein
MRRYAFGAMKPKRGAHWRLELTLNDVGTAFLLLDEFAEHGDPQLISS